MGGSRCKCERMNPYYIGPYPDKSCSSCPYGIYSGYVPCGWADRCKGAAERNNCTGCVKSPSKISKSSKSRSKTSHHSKHGESKTKKA